MTLHEAHERHMRAGITHDPACPICQAEATIEAQPEQAPTRARPREGRQGPRSYRTRGRRERIKRMSEGV